MGTTVGADAEALEDERRRLSELRLTVDLAAAVIAQGGLTHDEALALAAAARRRALALFPDKAATFDLILAPRLRRLVQEHAPGPSAPRAKVLPFRRPNG